MTFDDTYEDSIGLKEDSIGLKTRIKQQLKGFSTQSTPKLKRPLIIRILGGCYHKHRITCKAHVRPTLARARATVFDVLRFEEGWTFLDCFAGSGSMGLEALSRGASKVVFFDNNPICADEIRNNIKKMPNVPGMAVVFKLNIFKVPEGQPVKVIFLDPPYKDAAIIPDAVVKLEKYNWIDANTIIVAEAPKEHRVNLPGYDLINEKTISSSSFSFWQKQSNK